MRVLIFIVLASFLGCTDYKAILSLNFQSFGRVLPFFSLSDILEEAERLTFRHAPGLQLSQA
jgi:hypothetical protein